MKKKIGIDYNLHLLYETNPEKGQTEKQMKPATHSTKQQQPNAN